MRAKCEKHGGTGTRLHRIWNNMRYRCYNKNSSAYKNYGEKFIDVYSEWSSFIEFRKWALNNGYKDDLTIDRIDNNKGYYPENCRWADYYTQSRNTRKINKLNISGYRGIYEKKGKNINCWVSQIGVNNKNIILGHFRTDKEAAFNYDKYVIDNRLEHTLNFTKEEFDKLELRYSKNRSHYHFNSHKISIDDASYACEAYSTGIFTLKDISKYLGITAASFHKIYQKCA